MKQVFLVAVFGLCSAGAQFTRDFRITQLEGLSGQVAVDGEFAVAGATKVFTSRSGPGSAFLFERDENDAGAWEQVQEISASDGRSGDFFGSRVAISGNFVAVGAPAIDSDRGAVYIFERRQDSGAWEQTQKLSASDSSEKFFGSVVVLQGDVLMTRGGGGSTSVFVFRLRNEVWVESQILRATSDDVDRFGVALALALPYAFVGSQSDRVFIFKDSPTGFVAKQEVAGPAGQSTFGEAVAAEAKTLAISNTLDEDRKGAVNVFELDDATGLWSFAQRLVDEQPFGRTFCGGGVVVNHGTIVMRCPGATSFLTFFTRPPTGSFRFAKRLVPRKGAFFGSEQLTIQGDSLLLSFGRDEFVSFFSTPPASDCALPRTAFRRGNIIKRESGSSFDTCANSCRADVSCEVFTFVDAGSKRCTLRNGNFIQRNDLRRRFTSGPRFCPDFLCGEQHQRFRDGNRVQRIRKVADPKECENLCELHAECEVWTFDAPRDTCVLREGNVRLLENQRSKFFAGRKGACD